MTRQLQSMGFLLLACAACGAPATDAAAPAAMALDTAAVRAEVEAFTAQMEGAYMANDAAAIAALFADDATVQYQGMPTASGRANIQGVLAQYLSTITLTAVDITHDEITVIGPDLVAGTGVFHGTGQRNGQEAHEWWRFAASYRRTLDGQWRMAFDMAFPDPR